uniref:Shisa N-terminal domain-containing protein n=1 Tax=Amphiprion percula TaxID=161767 RepID=A0A3P8S7Z6_AMPPE
MAVIVFRLKLLFSGGALLLLCFISGSLSICMSYYCCGDCTYKYCCRDQTQRITQSQQEPCFNQDTLILGSVFPIILCVGLIICCVAPCCLCYKKCRKGGNRTHTVVQPAVQPHSPGGYQPDYPGYHPVPGFGDPMPPAPPPYSKLFHDILKLHGFVISLL